MSKSNALGLNPVFADPADESPVSPDLAPRSRADARRSAKSFGITCCFEIFGADDAAGPV